MATHRGLHAFLWDDIVDDDETREKFLGRLREEEEDLNMASKKSRNKKVQWRSVIALSWLNGIKKAP